jgi:hypothetical protein
MSYPARGKGWDPSLPTLGPIGTMGIDGQAIAAGRRQPMAGAARTSAEAAA